MYKLFVVGFPRSLTENALLEIFSDFGDIHHIKLVTNQQTGMSKGYAFVTFLDEAGARLAVKDLNETTLNDRTIYVRFAEDKPMRAREEYKPIKDGNLNRQERVPFTREKRPRIRK